MAGEIGIDTSDTAEVGQRILFVNSRSPSAAIGGAELISWDIAQACAQLGARVGFASAGDFSSTTPGSHITQFALPASSLYALQSGEQVSQLRRVAAHLRDLSPMAGFRAMRKVLRIFRPTVIVTNNVRGLGLGVPIACGFYSARWIHIPHDVQLLTPSGLMYLDDRPKAPWERPPAVTAFRAWTAFAFANVDLVAAPTAFMAEIHRSHRLFLRSRVEVLRLPRPLDPLSADRGDTDFCPQSARSAHLPRVLFIGRLSEHKGIVWALEALKNAGVGASVIVCGAGELEGEVIRLAQTCERESSNLQVDFQGPVDTRERNRLLRDADVVVVPSLVVESTSLVAVEAVGEGVTVVASDAGGVSEVVPKECLFQPGDELDFLRVFRAAIAGSLQSEGVESATTRRPTRTEYARRLLLQTG